MLADIDGTKLDSGITELEETGNSAYFFGE